MKILLLFLSFTLLCMSLNGQITANGNSGTSTTAYTDGSPNNSIYIWQANGLTTASGSLTATPGTVGTGGPYTFDWYYHDQTTFSWVWLSSSTGTTSTISGLASDGYRVQIKDNSSTLVSCYNAWVWNLNGEVSISKVDQSCTATNLTATVGGNTSFTYYNPPLPSSLVSATTTISVSFSATHTYVSDLAFYLIGPTDCGNPVVALHPLRSVPSVCNNGDNINNLIFTTASTSVFDMDLAATPLTGTYGKYVNNSSATVTIDWSTIYGCNAASSGWKVQIFDCTSLDVGTLTNASVSFSGLTSVCGSATSVSYNSGAISSSINDNSCTSASASSFDIPASTAYTTPITVNATSSYLWTSSPVITYPSSTTSSLTQNVTGLSTGTTTFTVTETISYSTLPSGSVSSTFVGTNSFTVISPSVTIASNDADNTICAGTSVTFTATPTNGGAGPTYQWKLNGTNVGTGGATYTTTSLVNGDVITCVLTSNAACATPTTATSTGITTTVNPVLVPSISVASSDADNTICTGTSVTFTATPTNGGTTPTYQWKLNGANVGTGGTTYTTTGLVNGDIVTCVLTSNALCASPTTGTSTGITTTVNPILTPSVSIASSDADNTICSGTSVTFTATPTNGGTAPTYQWKLNGVNVGTGGTTYTTTGLVNGDVVTCVLTSNYPCASPTTATSTGITTTVNPVLVPSVSITSSDADNTICAGTSVTFTATPTNGGTAPTYQWKLNGVNVGTGGTTYTTTGLVNGDVVTCILTSNATCVSPTTATSSGITTTVNPVLVPSVSISSSDADNTICAGTSVTFTATPTNGGTAPTYQWQLNGSNVGTGGTTYTTTGLVNGDVVTCVLTSNATCASPTTGTSTGITTTVNPVLVPSVSISSSDADNTICTGTSVTFTATPTNGGTTPTYQWKLNGVNVGTGGTTYTTTGLVNGDVVTCILTSNATCASPTTGTSTGITTTVNTVLVPSVSITSSDADNTICAGTSVTFTATPTNGGTAPTYQWKLNGANVGTGGTTYTTSTLVNGDVVTCVLTSNDPCASPTTGTSSGITTTVNPVLVPSVSIASSDADNTICAGTSVTFTATPTNGGTAPTYQWQLNGANVGTSGTTYTTTGLVNGDIVTCVLTSNATCISPTTATSSGITTTVNPVLVPSVSIASSDADNTICAGTSVTFTATPTNGGTAPTYQWQLNSANVGTGGTTYTTSTLVNGDVVTCVLTSNATCASPTTASSSGITITVNPVLVPSVSIASSDADNTICAGTSVTFTATPINGGTTPIYQWQLNGANVGTGGTTYTTTGLVNGDVITCVLTSNATCVSPTTATSSGITTTVNPVLVPSVSIASSDADNTICAGTSVTFTATPTNGGTVPTYQWQLNGANVGTGGTTYTTSTLANGDVVTYVLTSNATCVSPTTATSSGITTTVNPVLVPSISITSSDADNTICAGTSVTFTATTTNEGTTPTYQWKLNGINVGSGGTSYTTTGLVNGDVVTCVLTSNATCASPTTATSSGITTTVNPVLVPSVSITSSDADNTICAGTSVTFTATPTNGGTAPTYQWQLNSTNIGTGGNTYTTSTLANGDVVTCVLTSNATCVSPTTATSSGITTTVTPSPSATLTSGSLTNSQIICINTAITDITYSVNNNTSISVSSLPPGIVGNFSGGVYTIDGTATTVGTYNYTVTITGTCSPTFSVNGSVTVNPLPTVNLTSATGTDSQSPCINSTISPITYQIGGTATGVTVSGLPTGVSSSFSSGIVTISGTPTIAGSFSYSIETTGGCAPSSTVTGSIDVIALPLVNPITGPSIVCLGSTINLYDETTPGVWSSSAITIAPVTGGVVTGLSVGTVVISYTVTVNGCSAAATKTVQVMPLPTVDSIIGATTVCQVDTMTLANLTPSGVWNSSDDNIAIINSNGEVIGINPGLAVMNYSVTVNGCTSTSSVTITVLGLPIVQPITGDSVVCQHLSIPLSNPTTSGTWLSINPSIATVNSSTGIVTGISPGTTLINYTVTIAGCPTTQNTMITVNPTPNVASIKGDSNVCVGSTINLTDATSSGVWTSETTTIASVSASGNVTGLSSGSTYIKYEVTMVGCTGKDSLLVYVGDEPSEPLNSGDSTYCSNTTIADMEATASLGGTLTWYSDSTILDEIGVGTTAVPSNEKGTKMYYITEKVNGCEGLPSSIRITIEDCGIEIFTAFTPDNDGVNDKWILPNIDTKFPKNVVSIYNRWGQLIFQSPEGKYSSNPWDGTYEGKSLPVDSYYYMIEYNDDFTTSSKGNISIIIK